MKRSKRDHAEDSPDLSTNRRSFIGTAAMVGGSVAVGVLGADAASAQRRLIKRPDAGGGGRASDPLTIKSGLLKPVSIEALQGSQTRSLPDAHQLLAATHPSTRKRLLSALAQTPEGKGILKTHGLDSGAVLRSPTGLVSADLQEMAGSNALARGYIEGIALMPLGVKYADPSITSVGLVGPSGRMPHLSST